MNTNISHFVPNPSSRRMAVAHLLASGERWGDERFDLLVSHGVARIERIVSWGQASPPGFWYDQAEREWVLVLTGAARLRIEGEPGLVELGPGDAIDLPPHCRHRVEWTTPDGPTIWLAVHLPAAQPASCHGSI